MARGRHRRLSSIDLLPEEADEAVRLASAALNEGKTEKQVILARLNSDLAALGIAPISRSAFSRKSIALLEASADMRDARFIFEGLAPQLTPEKAEKEDKIISELLKTLIFGLVRNQKTRPKEAMELARAWMSTLQSRKLSAQQRDDEERRLLARAEKAVDAVSSRKGGITAEAKQALLEALRADLK